MKIIDRYISLEIIRPFLMVVIGVIVVMLSVRLSQDMKEIIVNAVPWQIVLKTVIYKIPEFVVLGLPIAYMIATLLGLARMSKDYEIVAIRSAGIGSKRIMIPILLISVMISGTAFFINEEVVPWANKESDQAEDLIMKSKKGSEALRYPNIHFKGVDTRFFSVRLVDRDQKTLEGILIFDSDPESTHKMLSAPRGTWEGKRWILQNGVVQEYDSSGKTSFVSREYQFQELEVDTRIQIENYLSGEIDPKKMSSKELEELIIATREGGQSTRDYEIEYQGKFARPFATFFAAIIAAPIGLKFARGGGYIGFAISIILTFLYFVMQTLGEGFGSWGIVPPGVAAWLPNLIFGVLGLFFLVQVD